MIARKIGTQEMRSIATNFLVVAGVLCISLGSFLPAWGHLCDDVWRQKDKLIVKPEFQNLVIKDKAQFKVFLQNNMDRAIEEISLEGKSRAFDIEITPEKMGVPNDRRVHFDVGISLREGLSSGKYPIHFRLVAKSVGKTFKEFDMDTELKREKALPPSPAPGPVEPIVKPPPAVTTHGVAMLRDVKPPTIDGDLRDPSWKKAAMFTNFKRTTEKRAICQTIVFLTADVNNIYIGFSCQEKYPERIREDYVEISIYPPVEEELCYTLRVGTDGTIRVYRTTTTSVRSVNLGINAKVVLPHGEQAWFAEVAIPVAVFGVKALKEEDTWRMNFSRERGTEGREISFWSGSPTTFRERSGCGKMHFLP